jgi:hypothetical protein
MGYARKSEDLPLYLDFANDVGKEEEKTFLQTPTFFLFLDEIKRRKKTQIKSGNFAPPSSSKNKTGAITIVFFANLSIVKLGYNELLLTSHFCSL